MVDDLASIRLDWLAFAAIQDNPLAIKCDGDYSSRDLSKTLCIVQHIRPYLSSVRLFVGCTDSVYPSREPDLRCEIFAVFLCFELASVDTHEHILRLCHRGSGH